MTSDVRLTLPDGAVTVVRQGDNLIVFIEAGQASSEARISGSSLKEFALRLLSSVERIEANNLVQGATT